MKKLVFALAVCLCASGLTVTAPSRTQLALAETQEDATEEEKARQAEEEKARQAEEEKARQAEEEI